MSLVSAISSRTPPQRDRALDALRGLAIAGVVLGHWLVTALVAGGGTVSGASPLQRLPALVPVTWLLQTLAVFFFVGGVLAGRSSIRSYRAWLRTRMSRLFRPVAALLAVWSLVAALLPTFGLDDHAVHTVVKLVLSPLWFLLVFAALTAATPLVARLHPGWPLLVVALVDAGRFGLGLPGWVGWVNLAAGWLVPYCLGARFGTGSRPVGWLLVAGGGLAAAGLVHWGGYPASMVGVPGEGLSNLNPPTLAAVTFGLAQCGAAMLLLGPLRRVLRRPALWAGVALLNLSAMTVFLWHQTALLAATGAAHVLAGRPLPGLHTPPDGLGWLAARVGWLPVFAVALLGCWALFHRYERPPARDERRVLASSRG
ncbi:acyltransferase [Dactylosporangium sp. AC04546]|uniref:acyltransferase family protein n=1 Tax=Dactylosporangium sp. AC04546 TaxID=2862460 RepID=UPI001EDF6CA2|nr:acyltransferase [Dactylosporangium sp. AC04546]WVK89399.1 acyltransferase [Dactylosporangium sp. AC04546]